MSEGEGEKAELVGRQLTLFEMLSQEEGVLRSWSAPWVRSQPPQDCCHRCEDWLCWVPGRG